MCVPHVHFTSYFRDAEHFIFHSYSVVLAWSGFFFTEVAASGEAGGF
jgi:hypothetical protein